MHILDFIMYWVIAFIIWKIMAVISGRQFTEELGGALVGIPAMILYTIIYIVIFCIWPDLNWIDIFKGVYNLNFQNWFKF